MAELIGMSNAAWRRQPSGVLTPNEKYLYPGALFFNASCPYGYNFPYTEIGTINKSADNAGIGVSGGSPSSYIRTTRCLQAIKGNHTVVVACRATSAVKSYVSGTVDEGSSYIEDILLNSTYEYTSAGKIEIFLRSETGSPLMASTNVIFSTDDLLYFSFKVNTSGFFDLSFNGKLQTLGYTHNVSYNYINKITDYPLVFLNRNVRNSFTNGTGVVLYAYARIPKTLDIEALSANPWQLFDTSLSRFYLIPSSSGSTSQPVSIDALIQRAGLTQSTSIDALLQSAFSRSLSIDGLIAAVQTGVISLDALLQIVGTRTLSVDALLQAAKTGVVSVDALVQMTLTQAISMDALIVAASASLASTDLDALIQSLKTAGISLDALLSQSKTATAVMDALIQASKAGTVSLDAIIAVASSTTVFVGLDALIQAIQSKTLSVDALLQKTYTNPLSLDAYVALTQIKTVSLDALLQNTKTGVISMDAILQMTKTAMVSFDALIQAAKTGVISLDAILVFATQASILLDAYVQKTLAQGVGLDAIIGAIADMILPTGRVITVPASDRFVFVTHSDRVIQIQ